MKELMTALATAATALFAIGAANGDEAPLNATSFEDLTAGLPMVIGRGDDGSSGDTYWFMKDWVGVETGDNGTLVSNEIANAATRPDCFVGTTQAKMLSLDTSSPLYRTVAANAATTNATGEIVWAANSGEAIGAGIYLDTLVKFTAADDVFGDDALATGDKIAISYVEQSDEVANPITNFVIRAGYIESSGRISAKNYEAKLVLPNDAKFDKDVWHRLTVRTVPNIDAAENGNVGFVVYVDETALVYADDDETIGDEVELVGVAATVPNSVFPSAVASAASGGSTITTASFSGTGAIDDVVFTKEMPGFLKETSEIPVTFTIPTGVSSVTVTYGAEHSVEVAVTPQNPTVNLPAGTEDFTLEVVADTENGYTYDGISGADIQNNVVTVSGASMAITINVTRNNFIYIDADDAQQSAVTLTEALAGVKAGGMIKLAYDYNVADYEGIPEEGSVLTISKSCVLDLNGNTLSATNAAEEAFIGVPAGVSLTVIDSSIDNTGTISYDADYSVFYAIGSCYIGAVEGDKGPTIVGAANSADSGVYIIRGKFDSAHNTNTAGDGFAWEIGDGGEIQCTAKRVGDYWVVEPNGGEQPTTYELTIPTVTGASATVTDKDTGDEIDDLAAIEDGTVVTVTWEADDGYKITANATEEITMDDNKTAGSPTVQPITYATLTITPVNNCTIVVSNATAEVASGTTFDVDDNVTLTVYRTPAEGFKLADGCAATEEIVMSVDRMVTASVVQDGEKTYPAYIDETEKTKYDSWATYAEISATDFPDAEGTNEEAYLLNCKPNEVETAKAAFKFTSISYDATEEKWVTTTTTSYNEREYNGTVTVKQYSDVGCTTESEEGSFFKAELK